jgi:TPR repeat protein
MKSLKFFPLVVAIAFIGVAHVARAADIGGWMQAQRASGTVADPCTEIIDTASREPRADNVYHAGVCYLRAERLDLFAAKAWLNRSASLGHIPAQMLVARIDAMERETHEPTLHCHDLGNDRKICHGGSVNAYQAVKNTQ